MSAWWRRCALETIHVSLGRCADAVRPSEAVAQSPDLTETSRGNYTYALCKSEVDWKVLSCNLTIIGIRDGISLQAATSKTKKNWCLRPGVKNKQVIDVAVSFMERHPEMRDYPTAVSVNAALRRAWPCSN